MVMVQKNVNANGQNGQFCIMYVLSHIKILCSVTHPSCHLLNSLINIPLSSCRHGHYEFSSQQEELKGTSLLVIEKCVNKSVLRVEVSLISLLITLNNLVD